jgi:hypothetical protein
MRPSLQPIIRRAARFTRAVRRAIRKLRRHAPDPRVIEELQAQRAAAARHIINRLAGLDAYRQQLAGDDPVRQDLLLSIERQACLTLQANVFTTDIREVSP